MRQLHILEHFDHVKENVVELTPIELAEQLEIKRSKQLNKRMMVVVAIQLIILMSISYV